MSHFFIGSVDISVTDRMLATQREASAVRPVHQLAVGRCVYVCWVWFQEARSRDLQNPKYRETIEKVLEEPSRDDSSRDTRGEGK